MMKLIKEKAKENQELCDTMINEFERYIEKLKADFYGSVSNVNDYAERKEVNGNHVSFGSAITIAGILIDFGCEVKLPAWEDDGCLKIPFIQVDDWRIEFDKGVKRAKNKLR